MTTREFWRSVAAIHDVVYFAPDAKQRYEAIGLKGFWMGYAASRSAALGTPGPEVVTAVFHGFAPWMVARALPDAWSMADRDEILRVRLDIARDRVVEAIGDQDVTRTADATQRLVEQLDLAGRPLAAAHAALPVPDDPIERLWNAVTVLREYRGDSHVAVLTAAGIGGASANALAVATGLVPENQRDFRGWSEQEWADAFGRLQQFGWVEGTTATETGRAARERLEDATDRSCGAGLDQEATARAYALANDLLPIARAVEASGAVSYPNPTGVPRP
ncbi:SCO6745 family protein [Aeromicrobium alkaliterrae]|uniref:SalK n=1 Tax=Aeromicrobium alkaliterrae TaxID=302168 RepID=A0ABN2JXL4_9ACTN